MIDEKRYISLPTIVVKFRYIQGILTHFPGSMTTQPVTLLLTNAMQTGNFSHV